MNQPYLTADAPPLTAIGAPLPVSLQPIVRSVFDEFLPFVEGTLGELRRAEPRANGLRTPAARACSR
jgi:hypothetical protein